MKNMIIILTFLIFAFNTHAYSQGTTISTGIMPFHCTDANDRRGEAVIGELSVSLSKYGSRFIKLVERSRMDELMKEAALGMGGIVDDATAVQLGKVHGIQVMVSGSITGNVISARAVHMETQKVIATGSAGGMIEIDQLGKKLAAGIDVFLAREDLKSLRNDSPDIDLQFWIEYGRGKKIEPSSAGTLGIGEPILFHFKSNRDGFLTIVDIQPGGDVVIIFPNDMAPSNSIRADVEYTIPSDKDSFEIYASEPAGRDSVIAFFTEKKVEWLDKNKLSGEGFKTVKEGEKSEMTRGIKVVQTGIKKTQWESKVIEFDTVEK